jgi:hypothetical protein
MVLYSIGEKVMSNMHQDQASKDALAPSLQGFLRSALMGVDDMLPARVVSYDDASNRAVIQPLVMMGTSDGKKVARAQVASVPVFRFGGGGFFIRFPIKAGDFGWLKANDRDISLILQRGGLEDWPNTERIHSFSDAMFFPDTLKDWVIDGGNADALVIQSMNGAVCIALHGDKITMTAPNMEVDIPNTEWRGNISLDGSFSVPTGGSVSIDGGSITHNGKDIGSKHKHGGVQPGSGVTSEVV